MGSGSCHAQRVSLLNCAVNVKISFRKNYQSRLQFLFRALDRDGDGFVSMRDLENVVLLLQNIGTSPAVHHYLEYVFLY
jgi:Ca2+-binding EF-hand superfamily protein